MMRSLIHIITFILIPLSGICQHSLSGTITDTDTKESLPGATVYIPNLHKGGSADVNGFYKITGIPSGNFLVEVRYIGYSTRTFRVNINGETKLDISLDAAATEISEVIITGTSVSTDRRLNPIPSATIDDIAASANASTNIVDAISWIPGISQITTGASVSKPVIRGLGYNRVVVLNNHVRQEGQQWGDEHGIEIDEYAVERVEIIKGPGSLVYGSDAMAGVIHFLPPRGIDEGKITANLITNYQSNNDLFGYSLSNQGHIKDINWSARLSQKNSGNYSNKYDGDVYNSGSRELNFDAEIGIHGNWGYSHLQVSNFNQELGLVEGERDASGNFLKEAEDINGNVIQVPVASSDLNGYKINTPSQGINHFKITSDNKAFIGKSGLSLTLAYQQNERKEFEDFQNPNDAELYFLLKTFNYDFKYIFPDYKKWETSAGISGMVQSSQNKGEEFLIPEYSLFDGGIFLFSQKKFGKFNLGGGLRYDIRTIDSEGLYLDASGEEVPPALAVETRFIPFETTFANVSASLGGSYSLSEKFILKLNLSRGFRSPNMAELGSNGVHEGTFRYEVGNPQLKSETSLQTDLGILVNSEHVSFEITPFYNAIQNYIFIEKLSSTLGGDSIPDPTDPVPGYRFVQGNASLFGGEAAVDIHPHPWDWLHFKNSIGFVRGINLDGADSTKYLPLIPAPKFQSELRMQFRQSGKYFQNLFFVLNLDYFFEQDKVFSAYQTETETPSYSLLHFGMGADLVRKENKTIAKLIFSVQNIFDQAYQNHLSRLKYAPANPATGRDGIYNMGRNFSVKLIIPLVLKG